MSGHKLGESTISAHKDAIIYRMLGEEIRSGAFFPGSEASVLTLQGKSCSLFRAFTTYFSVPLLLRGHY